MLNNESPETEPIHGWTTSASVDRVIDGDTIEVTITRTFRVRLRGNWSPETRTKNKKEKAAGLKAKARLSELCPVGSRVTVCIPTSVDGRVQDILTMERLLGHCWSTGKNVALQLVREGLAFPTKESEEAAFPSGEAKTANKP